MTSTSSTGTTSGPGGARPSPRHGPRAWAATFTGFYPAQADDLGGYDAVARFLYAARAVILVISAQAALLAGLLTLTDRRFELVPFVLVLLGYLVVHAISNLSNDWFGFKRGHDTPDAPRRRYTVHPLASGAVTTRLLATGLLVLGVLGLAIAVYFVVLRGWPAVALVAVGALLLWAYDAAPRALKELTLGEFAAFFVWGPLMVAGGYYVIAGQWSWAAVLASVPYGLGTASILIGKHIDQREFDLAKGMRTLPGVLGEPVARRLDQAVIAAMYVFVAIGVAVGALTPFALLVVLAAGRARHAFRVLSHEAPDSPPAGYVGWPLWFHRVGLVHNRMFGWLYVAGLALGALLPGSRLW